MKKPRASKLLPARERKEPIQISRPLKLSLMAKVRFFFQGAHAIWMVVPSPLIESIEKEPFESWVRSLILTSPNPFLAVSFTSNPCPLSERVNSIPLLPLIKVK
jgi:hypothetical protein